MNSSSKSDTAIVVGSGIIGIACAHYLSKAGMQVTVIDRKTIAGACSHGNCGYICPSHVLPLTEPGAFRLALKSLFNPNAPFRVKPQLNPTLWKWMWQFAKRCNHRQMLTAGKHLQSILNASMEEYRRLIQEEQLECEWTEKGLLYVLQSEKGWEEFSHTDQILSDHFGIKAHHILGRDLPTVDPALKDDLAGAFYYPGDASVRPDLLNAQWSDRLKQNGVKFVENCALQQIGKSAGRITHLKTSNGEMDADCIIFATGAWSPRLSAELECHIPIQPGKGYSVTMQRPDPCPQYPMLFPEHKVGVSPFQNGYRLGSMMEFSGYDTSIPQRRIQQLRNSARPYLITPFTEDDQQTWFGWRPMTWDSLPIIGQVPNLANAYLATGHNMLGMSLATATGKLIAEIIQARPTHIDASPFSPTRF